MPHMKRLLLLAAALLSLCSLQAQNEEEILCKMKEAKALADAKRYAEAADAYLDLSQMVDGKNTDIEGQVHVLARIQASRNCYMSRDKCETGYNLARDLLKENLTGSERALAERYFGLNGTLLSMRCVKRNKKQYEKARAVAEEVLPYTTNEVREFLLRNIARSWDFQSYDLFFTGYISEAIKFATKALNIVEENLGKEDYYYACSLSTLTWYYYDAADSRMLDHFANLYTYYASQNIKSAFASLTSEERTTYWQKYRSNFEERAHLFALILPSDSLSANGYNATLFSKGLLLNSDIEFLKLLQECGDNQALALYQNLRALRQQICKLLESPLQGLFISVDSLERVAQKKEKELVERSKVFGDYTKNLVISWQQVQERLGDKDIAVEFVSFPLNADSTMYIAYVLKKDWECPKMIPLFEEKQLRAVQEGSRYATDSISRLVWQPLDEVMQGVERVYFAPSGELYNIAIESIPTHKDGGETLVGEHREYYRLSSTRELALIKDESRWNEAAVYGGLQYGMSVEGMIEEDGKYERAAGQKRGDSTPSYYVVREDSTDRGDRGVAHRLEYLKGTEEEAKAIAHDLEQKAVDAQLFTDSIGTETSFKALNGKKTSIIHIGTHGFFNDRKQEIKDEKLQLLGMDNQPRVIEDDALTRSGLYFAGADNVILNGQSAVPDSIDDGRLTAAEIAQLDLRGLDMVVLSACQTGLGEITGDGVFGLQRGFKKAGAQTIVMSLWKVDDDVTTEFMTNFFQNIKLDENGRPINKYQAFRDAQECLRKKYNKPYYWAAFIMLDGED